MSLNRAICFILLIFWPLPATVQLTTRVLISP